MPSREHEMVIQMLVARPRPESQTIEESRAGFEYSTTELRSKPRRAGSA